MDHEVTLALDVHAQLGEGMHWDTRRQCLWMVDIHGQRLIQWDLLSTNWREWTTSHRVGWAIPYAARDELLLGLQPGMARARLGDELQLDWVACPFGDNAALRLNDAKADATGAVWAGSMNNDDDSRSDGCLFRLGPDGKLSVHDSGYKVANGPAISPDGKTLLHTDSGRRLIYSFDLDVTSGVLTNKRLWKRFATDEGYPDGMCFDADGYVWVAHWGTGCVSRLTADGALAQRFAIPAPRVTNVCFAGPGLNRLFVTTARVGMSATELDHFPLAGSVFEIRTRILGAGTFDAAH